LVPGAGPIGPFPRRGHECPRQGPQLLVQACGSQRVRQAEEPREDARDVAVDHGFGETVGDREHRARRVGADARQGLRVATLAREGAVVLGHDRARRLLQAARAAVVAQPAPGSEQVVFLGEGQRLHVGEALEESLPVGNHRGDLGLLQHRLADPDRVRVLRATPGQVACVCREPRAQGPDQRLPSLGIQLQMSKPQIGQGRLQGSFGLRAVDLPLVRHASQDRRGAIRSLAAPPSSVGSAPLAFDETPALPTAIVRSHRPAPPRPDSNPSCRTRGHSPCVSVT
jgi:hypothetical protein